MENISFDYSEKNEDQPELSASGINPKNPFENFTEYENYNSDYREIVPQIDIPGCEIPFEPSASEKKSIRRYFNLTGAGVLIHFLLSNGIMILAIILLRNIIMKKDNIKSSEATFQYLSDLERFFSESSINIALNMLIISSCSILIFLIGSKVSKIRISSYFQASDLTLRSIVSYCIISFALRYAGGFIGAIFEFIFSGLDLSAGTELMNYQTPKAIAIMALYACIVAPITEELMYRGFILKNLSRVSQRFGIFMSALIFGLMHGNVTQFIFTFLMGIFLAHIDIKHNSLFPSIIVHAFSNTFSTAVAYSGVLDSGIAVTLTGFAMFVLAIIGTVLLVKFRKKNRMPFTMPHQKLRNGTAVSSPTLMLSIVIYTVITIVNSFPSVADKIENFLTEFTK